MQRVVRCSVTDMQKKRAIRLCEFSNRFNGVIGECIRGIIVIWKVRNISVVVPELTDPSALVFWVLLFRVKKIAAAIKQPIILIESTLVWMRRLKVLLSTYLKKQTSYKLNCLKIIKKQRLLALFLFISV